MFHLNKMQSCFFQYVKKLHTLWTKIVLKKWHFFQKKIQKLFKTIFCPCSFQIGSRYFRTYISNLRNKTIWLWSWTHRHSTYSNDLENGRSVMIFWVVWPSIILLGTFGGKDLKCVFHFLPFFLNDAEKLELNISFSHYIIVKKICSALTFWLENLICIHISVSLLKKDCKFFSCQKKLLHINHWS